MTVVLPQKTQTRIGTTEVAREGPPPVLYLLHGLSDDDSMWSRRTSIERYAEQIGLAVVMPAGHRSFYSDMVYGGRYWTYLSEELPQIVQSMFQVSTARQDTFVAGLSMGGYGAMRWALAHPERFAAAASLSGALDVGRLRGERGDYRATYELIYGDGTPSDRGGDLFAVLADIGEPQRFPDLLVTCGTEDELFKDSQRFVDHAQRAGLSVRESYEPGEHEWGYWDHAIQQVLRWLPLR